MSSIYEKKRKKRSLRKRSIAALFAFMNVPLIFLSSILSLTLILVDVFYLFDFVCIFFENCCEARSGDAVIRSEARIPWREFLCFRYL
jgi:hypothetical protein